jgi:bifunctional DNase/RNase
MKVSALTVDPFTSTPIVILKDHAGRKSVPIWIGMIEASADLMSAMVKQLDARVERVEVRELVDHTFYATLHLVDAGGRAVALDARPSDAIALAMRAGAKILVAQKVIDKVKRIDLRVDPPGPDLRRDAVQAESSADAPAGDAYAAILDSLDVTAFGKWKM